MDEIKVDWDSAPEWAQWFAVDESGDGYFFKDKPIKCSNTWKVSGSGGVIYMDYYPQYEEIWQESLQERPKK